MISVGRIVHYVVHASDAETFDADELREGQHLAAFVVGAVGNIANLVVYRDVPDGPFSFKVDNVVENPSFRPGSWHYPERT